LALNAADQVPKVPAHIAKDPKAGRGVGVFEREGDPAQGVFKGYYASMDAFSQWLESHNIPKTASPRPSAAQVAQHSPSADGIPDNEDTDRGPMGGDSAFADGGRKPKKRNPNKPVAAASGGRGGAGSVSADFRP